MVTAPEKLGSDMSETELMVEEFRQKVVQTLQREKDRLRENAEKEAKNILTKAYQEAAQLASQAQEEYKQTVGVAKEQAQREAEYILSQAREQAEQVLRNNEETIRREAKEKTKKEVESIIRSSKEEAARISARTIQEAKDEASEIIAQTKKESDELIRQMMDDAEREAQEITRSAMELKQKAAEEMERAQREARDTAERIISSARENAVASAEKEAAEIIAQAKIQGQQERQYILANAMADAKRATETETAQILLKARQEADDIVNKAKEKMRIQLEDSSRLMLEIQQKMHQVIGTAGPESNNQKTEAPVETKSAAAEAPSPAPVFKDEAIIEPAAAVNKEENKSASSRPVPEPETRDVKVASVNTQSKTNSIIFNEEDKTYQGRLKIDVAPPVDNEQVNVLEQHLMNTPGVQVIIKGGAQDGSAWIEVDISSPVSLLDVLRKIPGVKDVVGCKSYVIIAMKSRQLV